jgi:methyl-accepting chemotaxis protein
MRIRTWIHILAGSMSAIIGFTCLLALLSLRGSQTRMRDHLSTAVLLSECREAARGIQVHFMRQVQEWKNLLLRGYDELAYEEHLGRFTAEEKLVTEEGEKLRRLLRDGALATERVEAALRTHAELGARYRTALKTFDQAGRESFKVDEEVKEIDRPLTEEVERVVDDIQSHSAAALNDIKRRSDAETTSVSARTIAIAAAGGGVAIVIALIFLWGLTRNVNALLAESRTLAACVTSGRLDARGRMQAVNADFKPVIQGINSIMDAFSDLPAIQECAKSMAEASVELTSVSRELTNAADKAAAQAYVVSSASEQVSKNVQTLATGAEEMSASIKEIAKNAFEAARVATQAVHVAESTNSRVGELGDSSLEIGKIVKVITSIAEQTNLLALNATIEAARAGDAGKGFAVVANEVKELARETAKATEDIGRRVDSIQGSTKSAVQSISEINAIIHRINDIQNAIASAVEEQSVTSGEIGRNISEVAAGSTEIAKNITLLATAATTTANGAGETKETATNLARMAGELERLVGKTARG